VAATQSFDAAGTGGAVADAREERPYVTDAGWGADVSVVADASPEAAVALEAAMEDAAPDQVERDASASCGCKGDYTLPVSRGNIDGKVLPELSGLAASRIHPGVIFAHNDSGDSARFFALRDTGALLREYDLTGAVATDWEDIAIGPCPQGSCVYLADIGDNDAKRADYSIYRVAEPDISADAGSSNQGGDLPKTALAYERFRFTYPDRAHNAETLLVHPTTGDVYVVTKEAMTQAAVYRLPAEAKPDASVSMILVPSSLGIPVGELVTGGDVDPCGTHLLLRTYTALHEYTLSSGQPFESIFSAPGVHVPTANLTFEAQGEAVTYAADGRGYFTSSEANGAATVELHAVSCVAR
jgi:hypothetical protein